MEGDVGQSDFMDDMDLIRDRIVAARAKPALQEQYLADTTKGKLCDEIQVIKKATPGLAERILALETTDNELFQFIRRLEYIYAGIWCDRCSKIKTVEISHFTDPVPDVIETREPVVNTTPEPVVNTTPAKKVVPVAGPPTGFSMVEPLSTQMDDMPELTADFLLG